MISPMSLHHYMTIIMGYNTQGISIPTLRCWHPLHMLNIVPSKCDPPCKILLCWDFISSSSSLWLFFIGLSHHAWGSPLSPRLNMGVICSIPQNDLAATMLQSDCASPVLAVLRTWAGDAVSSSPSFSLSFSSFHSSFAPVTKAIGSDKPNKVWCTHLKGDLEHIEWCNNTFN
jgi:hypothetical protein